MYTTDRSWIDPSAERTDAPVYSYSQLRGNVAPGTKLYAVCRYADGALESFARELTYGVDPPVEAEQLGAQLADWRERIELLLPKPTLLGMPGLTNQRVGIESWYGLPTFAPPPPLQEGVLELRVDPNAISAEITVPVPGRPAEVVRCSRSGVGPDGRPNGDCTFRPSFATGGPVAATVRITYQVHFSSPLIGPEPEYLGPVTMTSDPISVHVKDLQATAS